MPRDWQREGLNALMETQRQGKKQFLCVATPGSGKTKFALMGTHRFFRMGLMDRVVVVTPTDYLKRQWAAEAAEFAGIDLDPDFANAYQAETSDFHGVAVTYSLIGLDKAGVHKHNTINKRTLVILDEVHHAGDNKTWGTALIESFKDAEFIICLSGTAFRTDDCEIPFVTYKDRVSVSDYEYTYERAIKDNVCRSVYFSIHDGKMKWAVDKAEFEHTFKDFLTPDQVSKRLRTALDAGGNWVRDVLRAADDKLKEIRNTHADAGAMVFASSQQHAKEIKSVLERITGSKIDVVISEDDKGREKIERFARTNDRWIISVKMISEGVDIPRLRVGVYMTNIKTEMFFRQSVGRFVRVLKGLKFQDAFMFIPGDREIIGLAETIQEERNHVLDQAEKSSDDDQQRNLFGEPVYTPALKGKFQAMGAELTTSKLMSVNVDISKGAKFSVVKSPSADDPIYIQKERLRDYLNTLAKRYARRQTNGNPAIHPDYSALHKLWRQNGGKPMEMETLQELEKRVQFYEARLREAA
jgi:superfamily II DNA or RNA helicase